jgi:hypothetical protein
MDKNIITLIVTIITLIISALFSLDKIPLNMAFFYLLAVNGILFGSMGMAFSIPDKETNVLFPVFGMIMFVGLGIFCKVYIPVLYFSDLVKQ